MIKTPEGEIIYENQIEELFYSYCEENNIDLSKRNINDNDATCIWRYIYNILFKPDENTIRYNNKTSKLDYSDINTLHSILDIYIDLCYRFNILPLIWDFMVLTGITRETMNTWEHGEYRGAPPGAMFKHSDIAKRIKEAARQMTIKDLHGNPMGQMALANNAEEVGLHFAKAQAQAQLEARIAISQDEIKRLAAMDDEPPKGAQALLDG